MDISELFPKWKNLTEKQRLLVRENAVSVEYEPKQLVNTIDNPIKGILIIESGKMRVFTQVCDKQEYTLYVLENLDICLFTSSDLIKDIHFDVTLEALVQCKAYYIPNHILKQIVSVNIHIQSAMSDILAARFSDVMSRIEENASCSVERRVILYLLSLSDSTKSDELDITQMQIANYTGLARETVSRKISQLKKKNVIETKRNKIYILDREKLISLA